MADAGDNFGATDVRADGARAILSACPCCGRDMAATPRGLLDAMAISPLQRRIANRLAGSFAKFVKADKLIDAMYGDRADGGPATAAKIVDIEVHYLRKLLLLSPLAIETAWNYGGRRLVWRSAVVA